jgi:hypothetical protein
MAWGELKSAMTKSMIISPINPPRIAEKSILYHMSFSLSNVEESAPTDPNQNIIFFDFIAENNLFICKLDLNE